MEFDDFTCTLCNSLYDEQIHIPRMLTKCGHTYCQVCLRNNHMNSQDNSLKCPDDHTQHENIKQVEDLPKNLTLINLLKKSSMRKNSRTYTEQKRTSLGILARSTIPKFGGKIYLNSVDEFNISNNLSNHVSVLHKDNFPQSDSLNRKSLNNFCNNYFTGNYPYTNEFSLNEAVSGGATALFCNQHRRPLEIACLDHKIKICTTCALFGEHKRHNLKSEDDIIKDITVKAECLIELYELVEKNSEIFENNLHNHQRQVEEIKVNLKEENEKIKEKAKLYFKELRFLLKTKEKEIVEILDEKLENCLEKRFNYVKNISKETRHKTAGWKKEVQEYLDNLNNANESYEIMFEFLDNKKDLITPAEKLTTDIVAAGQTFNEKIDYQNLDFNIDCDFQLFNTYFDNFCKITERTSEASPGEEPLKKEFTKYHHDTINKIIDKELPSASVCNNITMTPKKTTLENSSQFGLDSAKSESYKNDMVLTESNIEEEMETNRIILSTLNFAHSTGNLLNRNVNNLIDQKSNFQSPKRYNTGNNFETSYSNHNTNYNLFTDTSFMSCEDNNNYNTFFKESRTAGKNQLLMDNSFSSETRLNTTTSLTNKKPSLNGLTSDKIVFIKNQLKNEVANFTGYSIGDEEAKKISEILLANQFSQSPNKKNVFCKIKELKLTKVGITDEGFSHIANCICKNNQIHTLNVSKNKLKDESCLNVLNIIKTNKNLKYLNFTFNNFSQAVKDKIKNISKNLNPSLKIEI